MLEQEWVPSETEIDEAMALYGEWLTEAFHTTGGQDEAIELVTMNFAEKGSPKAFNWISENNPDRIYDIDEALFD